MFGSGPFFGGSIFQTPAGSGQYSYTSCHSGFQNSGGSFNGYVTPPNQPMTYVC